MMSLLQLSLLVFSFKRIETKEQLYLSLYIRKTKLNFIYHHGEPNGVQ